MRKQNAQGTTEYLIVIAIVVVIGLLIASLATNLFDQAQITQTSEQLKGTIGSSGINIIDAIADYETEGILNLKNNSGETLTLTKITTEEGTQEYDNEQWVQGNTELININNLCQCQTNQKTKTCNFQIEYTTQHGLTKKITQTITVNCQETITTNKPPVLPLNCFNENANPIEICSLQDLNQIRTKLNGNYILMKNIDATPTNEWNLNGTYYEGWEPIGYCPDEDCTNGNDFPFTGNFNGNNKIINNLYIYRNDKKYIGLFGYINNATLSDLGLIDSNITGSEYVGGITGYNLYSELTNLYTTGYTTGFFDIGGITGANEYSEITNSHTTGDTNGVLGIGGIAGANWDSTITNSYTTGDINGVNFVGGITGDNSSSTITNSYSTGNTTGTESIGGITGYNSQSTITNSYSTGNTTGTEGYTGGISGYNYYSEITNSYSTGNTSGTTNIGGITGLNSYSIITNNYSTGNTNGTSWNIGGIIGHNYYSEITNSYSTGNTTGTDLFVGGITGYDEYSTITNSYSTGNTTGTEYVGGITGINLGSTITNCYWDVYRTNQNNCCGSGTCTDCFGKNIDNLEPNAFFPLNDFEGDYNVPMQHNINQNNDWTFGEDGNWTQQENNYPILTWQNN